MFICFFAPAFVDGQTGEPAQNVPQNAPQSAPITVRFEVVLVPVLVKDKHGEGIFSLHVDALQLETDMDAQPIALAIIAQTGGQCVAHLRDYDGLSAALNAFLGNVPHSIGVVGFDSQPHLANVFSSDTDEAAKTPRTLAEEMAAQPF